MKSQYDISSMMGLLKLSESELFDKIINLSAVRGLEVDACELQHIFIHGTVNVTLVAHLDTAGKLPLKMVEHRGIITQGGVDGCVLGADDRAGVYALLYHFLPLATRPNLLFTCGEERGCLGTKGLLTDVDMGSCERMNKALMDSLIFIQIDRRGVDDCVFYNQEPKRFRRFIESFGFKSEMGSFSDISELCGYYMVCGVNLSAGYLNEHSGGEVLIFPALLNTIDKVKRIIERVVKKNKVWVLPEPKPIDYKSNFWWYDREGAHQQIAPRASSGNGYDPELQAYYRMNGWDDEDGELDGPRSNCRECGKSIHHKQELKYEMCFQCQYA